MIVSGTDTKSTLLTMNTTAAVFTISRKPCSGSNGIRVHDPTEAVFTKHRNTQQRRAATFWSESGRGGSSCLGHQARTPTR